MGFEFVLDIDIFVMKVNLFLKIVKIEIAKLFTVFCELGLIYRPTVMWWNNTRN